MSRRKHPTCDLWILNYTPQAQFDNEWNEATIMCRGLIVDANWNIIGRPFKKFFTIEQLTSIRNKVHHLYGRRFKDIFKEGFITMDKMDGSLGVIYYNPFNDTWEIATRGSFASDQAIEGTKILQEKYASVDWVCGYTYMVEIIYPDNRIVVDYGAKRDLILLGVVDNKTGLDAWDEWKIINTRMPFAKLYRINTKAELDIIEPRDNAEGFVLVFHDSFRLKFKYEEYKRLHFLMTGITNKKLWEWERDGYDVDLKDVPDEFYKTINSFQNVLRAKYKHIEAEAKNKLHDMSLANPHWTRKDLANAIKDYQYKELVFAMVDEKDYTKMIWRLLKPVRENDNE